MRKAFLIVAALAVATFLTAFIFQNIQSEHTRTTEFIAAGLAASALILFMVDKYVRSKSKNQE